MPSRCRLVFLNKTVVSIQILCNFNFKLNPACVARRGCFLFISLSSSHKPQYPRPVVTLHSGKSEVGKKAENRGGNKKPPRAERKSEQNRQKAEHRAKLVHNLVAAHGFCYRFRGKTGERICLRAVCRHFRFPLFYAKLSVKCLFKRFF